MSWVSIVAIGLACAACQPYPSEQQVATLPAHPESSYSQSQAACRGFSAPVTTGGKPEEANGQACQQPDGSWRMVQNTPGLPAQTYVLPAPRQQEAATSTAAQASAPGQPTADANAPGQPSSSQPPCTSYTAPVTVGGQPQQAVIEACPQPDGSWRITQNTPGLPTQVYEIPAPASSPYSYEYPYPTEFAYPDLFPYWFGTPWFFGLGPSIVVVRNFHHFHHGFGHGFPHGFGRGFGGFGHGFAAARGGGGHR
jgi:surface antigen